MNKEWQKATKQDDLEKVPSLLEKGVDINSRREGD